MNMYIYLYKDDFVWSLCFLKAPLSITVYEFEMVCKPLLDLKQKHLMKLSS